jgi:nucleoside-diphosphate-sugar epimerase
MENKKKILITGASGFIGGYLVREALDRNYEVWAGVRKNSSRKNLTDPSIHFIDLSYSDIDVLVSQLTEIAGDNGTWDYIIHNAGITKAINKEDFYKVNALNTNNFLKALNKANCKPKKFLLMSSLSSYGPVDERNYSPIRIDDIQQPNSIYGKSKLEAEQFLKSQTEIPYVILLPTGVYGPGDEDYLMMIKSIKSGVDFKVGFKKQLLTFIYVADLVKIAFSSLEKENVFNKSIIVSDGNLYSDNEFSNLIKTILGKRFVVNIRIPVWFCYVVCSCSEILGRLAKKAGTLNRDKYNILKQRNWNCVIDDLVQCLDYKPVYDLNSGLLETINYAKKNSII